MSETTTATAANCTQTVRDVLTQHGRLSMENRAMWSKPCKSAPAWITLNSMLAAIRFGLIACVAGSWAVAAPIKNPAKKDSPTIFGEWVSATDGDGVRHVFAEDGKYLRVENMAGRQQQTYSTYVVNTKKNPAEFDITHPGPKFTFLGIYKIEGDTLTLCISGQMGRDRPTKFENSAEPPVLLVTYKRVKPKD